MLDPADIYFSNFVEFKIRVTQLRGLWIISCAGKQEEEKDSIWAQPARIAMANPGFMDYLPVDSKNFVFATIEKAPEVSTSDTIVSEQDNVLRDSLVSVSVPSELSKDVYDVTGENVTDNKVPSTIFKLAKLLGLTASELMDQVKFCLPRPFMFESAHHGVWGFLCRYPLKLFM